MLCVPPTKQESKKQAAVRQELAQSVSGGGQASGSGQHQRCLYLLLVSLAMFSLAACGVGCAAPAPHLLCLPVAGSITMPRLLPKCCFPNVLLSALPHPLCAADYQALHK
jgi:hypothetical protein